MKEPEQTSKNLILIVDDNYKNLQLLGNVLRQENLEIAVATNGLHAIRIVKEVNPSLILLDVMMPEIDGYEVCKILKSDPETESIPVIFLTAKNDSAEVIQGLSLGAVDYITKPFNTQELFIRVKTHLALRNSNEELKKINATKDKFFSIIAHDLKNPFITMLGFSSMLVTDYYDFTDEERISYLSEMEGVAKKSHQLLENLLQWSRSQTGRLEYIPKVIDLNDVISEIFDLVKVQAKTKDIQLIKNCKKDSFVFADDDMLTTVVRNLIANAIKFTRKGGAITVESNKENDFYTVNIADTGVGMDEKILKSLFKIEVQQSQKGTNNEQGTGLGLILCREFAERNGGKIWATSQPDKGSVFSFTVPAYDDK